MSWTDEIKKRLEGARPGPWGFYKGRLCQKLNGRYPIIASGTYEGYEIEIDELDAIFIENAPTDIKNLLEEREVLREALKWIQTDVNYVTESHELDLVKAKAKEALAWEPNK